MTQLGTLADPPRCDCHGEPMYWHNMNRPCGGLWRCLVRKRELQRVRTDKRGASQKRYWEAPEGGYVKRRRRQLREQRARILDQLAQLEREAAYRA